MKICIWCRKNEQFTSFLTKAHTIPDSLGGNEICENVCDTCNKYFGNHSNGLPSIETIIKEVLNISKYFLLGNTQNKNQSRFKSVYFNINFKNGNVSVKPKYSLKKNFQENIAEQFTKGMYKIYLEENERKNKNSILEKFNFIRNYARYNLEPKLPLLYFRRTIPMIFATNGSIENPNRTYWQPNLYTIENEYFFEFELFSHIFAIAKSPLYEIGIKEYFTKTIKEKKDFKLELLLVEKWTDIDFTLRIFKSQYFENLM